MYRVRERLRKKKRKAKPMKDWILEKKGEKREREQGQQRCRMEKEFWPK